MELPYSVLVPVVVAPTVSAVGPFSAVVVCCAEADAVFPDMS